MDLVWEAALTVGGITAASLVGLALVRRRVDPAVLEPHQAVAGYIVAVVGVIYGVLLALVVLAVWSDFEEARLNVELEANELADVYRLAGGLPAATRDEVRAAARQYTLSVVEDEWPAMAADHDSTATWDFMDALWRQALAYQPATTGQEAVHTELLAATERLSDHRRLRLLESRHHLPWVLWTAVLAGAGSTIGFAYLFGVRHSYLHAVMTGLLAWTIGLSIFVLLALDRPFSGSVRIRPDAFELDLALFDRLDAAPPTAP
jgi:hypothetical protein